jgi:hypothetical protein
VRETVFGRSQRFSYLSNKTLFSAEQILSRARLVQGKYRVGKTSTDLFLLGRILAQEKLAGSIAKKKRKQQALGFRLLALGFAHYIRDGWGIVFVEPDGWPQSLKPEARSPKKCGPGQPPGPHLLVDVLSCLVHRAKAMKLRSRDAFPKERSRLERFCESRIRSEPEADRWVLPEQDFEGRNALGFFRVSRSPFPKVPPAIHPREPPVSVSLCSPAERSEHLTHALSALCGKSVSGATEN